MGELITEAQPRIKFQTLFLDTFLVKNATSDLQELAKLMYRIEELGAAPVLNDGKVGGNCGIALSLADTQRSTEEGTLVSKSGKAPGAVLSHEDFVMLNRFDHASWTAAYSSRDPSMRPSSDSPLLWACLNKDCKEQYGWGDCPKIAIHGHALAEGSGLEYAAQQGLPISSHETLFSTPEDLHELEQIFKSHPYPKHKCYIRKGHGFFVIGQSCSDVEATFNKLVLPFLSQQGLMSPASVGY